MYKIFCKYISSEFNSILKFFNKSGLFIAGIDGLFIKKFVQIILSDLYLSLTSLR
jgi:hypothetical protein